MIVKRLSLANSRNWALSPGSGVGDVERLRSPVALASDGNERPASIDSCVFSSRLTARLTGKQR